MKVNSLKYLFLLICSLVVVTATAQLEFNFSDTTVTECKGILYDNGGDGVNYLHNSDQTFTICLDAPGFLTITFESFCVEAILDSLTFHLGPDEFSPQIALHIGGLFHRLQLLYLLVVYLCILALMPMQLAQVGKLAGQQRLFLQFLLK